MDKTNNKYDEAWNELTQVLEDKGLVTSDKAGSLDCECNGSGVSPHCVSAPCAVCCPEEYAEWSKGLDYYLHNPNATENDCPF